MKKVLVIEYTPATYNQYKKSKYYKKFDHYFIINLILLFVVSRTIFMWFVVKIKRDKSSILVKNTQLKRTLGLKSVPPILKGMLQVLVELKKLTKFIFLEVG